MKRVWPSEVRGTLRAPASKSMVQRCIALGTLSEGVTTVAGATECDDVLAAIAAARGLGAQVSWARDEFRIRGPEVLRAGDLPCGESGLCLRSFAPIAALADGWSTLRASGSLARRPVGMIVEPLEALGAACRTAGGLPPVEVRGPLAGGRAVLEATVTSQVLTGLLLALPRAPGDSEVVVEGLTSRPYVEMTLDLLRQAGARIEAAPDRTWFHIPSHQRLAGRHWTAEGDFSGAAFLLVAGALGGEVTVEGLSTASRQADRRILEALVAAGASVETGPDRVVCRSRALHPFEFDCTDCPDLVPPLAALAAAIPGPSRLRGSFRLRHKESDRSATLRAALAAMGISAEDDGESLRVFGGRPRTGVLEAASDHRIAMAGAVAALRATGPVTIRGAECVSKSYPGFFQDLAHLGVRVEEVP